MFDIGFWELALIGVVALLVIGPERLPGVMRACGLLLGKVRQTTNSIKLEIKQELDNQAVLQTLKENTPISELRNLANEVTEVAHSMTAPLDEVTNLEKDKPQSVEKD